LFAGKRRVKLEFLAFGIYFSLPFSVAEIYLLLINDGDHNLLSLIYFGSITLGGKLL
jgi:hypothetical protein